MRPSITLRSLARAVLLLRAYGSGLVTGGQDNGVGVYLYILRLLAEVDAVGRAGLDTLAAEDAVVDIDQCFLGHSRGEGDVSHSVRGAARTRSRRPVGRAGRPARTSGSQCSPLRSRSGASSAPGRRNFRQTRAID